MYSFVANNQVIATADAAFWLEYLFTMYPTGQIVEGAVPMPAAESQPAVDGAQTL